MVGTDAEAVHEELAAALRAALGADGGLGWHEGEAAEVEPTALAALALDDDAARGWLLGAQNDDGGFALRAGEVANTAPTALAALALPDGDARDRALDRAVADRSRRIDELGDYPLAWGWTTTTYSWVEPTARVLLALRRHRPGAGAPIDEAVASLAEREVVGGGWNYGNADVRGTDLKPYAQTTAVAVLALQGLDDPMVGRGVDALRTLAADEVGGLSSAQALLALRCAAGDEGTDDLVAAVAASWERTAFLGDLGVLAWAVLATAEDLDAVRVAT